MPTAMTREKHWQGTQPKSPYRRGSIAVLAAGILLGLCWLIPHLGATSPSATRQAPPKLGSPTPTVTPRITWQNVSGIDLPISTTAGPHCITPTRAACFRHDDFGAAIAAAHLLIRTFAFTGPGVFGPAITGQVTGPAAPAMARLTAQTYQQAADTAGLHHGEPLLATGTSIAGYQLTTTPDGQTVHILIRQDHTTKEATVFTQFTVRLTWQDGDWRLIAPAWGDWQSAAQPVTDPDPTSWRAYDVPLVFTQATPDAR